jgi:Skp family chaperone for outer membrane proteins
VLAAVLAPHAGWAQGDGKLPVPVVAVVDIQLVLRDANAAKDVRTQRDKYLQSYQNEFAKDEERLRQADQELARQRSVLAAEAFTAKRQAFEQQVAEFQRKVQSRRRGLDRAYNTAMNQLQDALIKVTDELAQEKGANLILLKSQTFLLDPKMEITASAIERLNKRMPTIKFPEPKDEPEPAPPPAGKK